MEETCIVTKYIQRTGIKIIQNKGEFNFHEGKHNYLLYMFQHAIYLISFQTLVLLL